MNPYSNIFRDQLSVEAEAEFKKLTVMEELLELMSRQGISRTELAKRMEVGPSRVTSMLSGANNFTIETLVRAGRAVGAEFLPHFVPEGHLVHFSTCHKDEVHQAFKFRLSAKPVPNVPVIYSSDAALTDDTAAA